MLVKFSPVRRDDTLVVSKSGEVLTINDEEFDFSVIPNGASLPSSAVSCEWVTGDLSRDSGGVLTITLILPHGANPSDAVAFPADLEDPADGVLELPI